MWNRPPLQHTDIQCVAAIKQAAWVFHSSAVLSTTRAAADTENLVGNQDWSVPTTRPLQLPDPLAAFLTHALPRANFPSHPGRRGNKSSILVSVREIFANSDMRTSSQPVQVGTANNVFLVPRISNQYNQPFWVRSRKFRKCRTSRTSATLQRETALIASQRLLNPNGTPKAGGTMRVIVVNNASSMEGGCRSLHTECFYMLQQAPVHAPRDSLLSLDTR